MNPAKLSYPEGVSKLIFNELGKFQKVTLG